VTEDKEALKKNRICPLSPKGKLLTLSLTLCRYKHVDKYAHQEGESIEDISAIGYGWAGFESLDSQWLEAMALWTATHGLLSMTAFQTQTFFEYVPTNPTDGPVYLKQVETAISQKQRTTTYDNYRQLVQKYGY